MPFHHVFGLQAKNTGVDQYALYPLFVLQHHLEFNAKRNDLIPARGHYTSYTEK